MEEDELLRTAFSGDPRPLQPAAVPPALLVADQLLGSVLRVVDENIRSQGELPNGTVMESGTGFSIGGQHKRRAFHIDPVGNTFLRVIQRSGTDDSAIQIDRAFVQIEEVARRAHGAHVHWKVRVDHLAFHRSLQLEPFAQNRVEKERIAFPIKRSKEGNALNMIPVEVGHEDVPVHGVFAELAQETLAARAQATTAVQNDERPIRQSDFDAGGVATVARIAPFGCGS